MRSKPSRTNRSRWPEIAVVLSMAAIVLTVSGIYTATRDGSNHHTVSVVAAASPTGAIVTPTASGTSTSVDSTPIDDEDVATYRALLTATPVYVAPKPTGTVALPTQEPLPPFTTGISSAIAGIFSPAVFRFTNEWQGMTSAGFMMVFAGYERDQSLTDGGPSAVRVYTVPVDDRGAQAGAITLLGDFLAPGDPGELEITSVDGDIVHLNAANGDQLTFNVVTQTYES